jgi:hypothetical protein
MTAYAAEPDAWCRQISEQQGGQNCQMKSGLYGVVKADGILYNAIDNYYQLHYIMLGKLENSYEIIRRTKRQYAAGRAYGTSGADGEAAGGARDAGGHESYRGEPEEKGCNDH